MSLIKWNDTFSVQITAMDNQHQKLFELLNKLHDAMSQGKGRDTLPEVFNNLIEYTKSHFADEEALMKKYDYPGFNVHKNQHDKLIAQVVQLQTKFLSGDLSASIQTRDFLKQWLVEHIQGTDQKYSKHLKERGLS